MPAYVRGSSDPAISPDPGAGTWNGTPIDAANVAKKLAIIQALPSAYVAIGDDAAAHMAHYLRNSGTTYTIDLEDMLDDVPSARALHNRELEQAKSFVETLPLGLHAITSSRAANGYNLKSESWNWFYAIGGYSVWGKGTATVVQNRSARAYALIFQYKFYDRYNWDGGKSVTIAGVTITDDDLGELHRQGLAREFDCVGSLERAVSWGAPFPTPAPVGPVTPPPPTPPASPSHTPSWPPAKPSPKPPSTAPSTPKLYVVRPGDSLSAIAKRKYGNAGLWRKIYEANKILIGPNPNLIHPGQHLFIP